MTSTTMEHKTVFKASISGSVEAKDSKESEAYMVSVVYSDGSKSDLQKTYEQFIELQGKVYNLLKLKSGYSRKTSRTLISSLPDNNSTIARLLFKDDDLKKMGKIQDFIKEIFTLPQVVSQSEDVLGFFSSSNEEQVPNDRLEEEEKLKRVNKVAEILTGRDPLRNIPEKSSTYETAWKPENLQRLSDEARDNLYQKLNRLNSRRPSKEIPTLPGNKMRPASTDDDLEPKRQPQRPGLRRRPFSVAVGVADLGKETPADTQIINKKANSGKVSRGPVSVDSDLEDPQIRKIASQFGKRVGEGESSPKTTKFVAVSPLLAEQRGEVSLKEGEEVEVLQKESNGWWYVKIDSCEGWAPASFLEPVTTSRSGSPTSTIQPRKSENQESSCKLEDDLDTCPEEAGKEDFENDTPTELQGSQKNFERLVESGSQKQPFDTEMNRRVKFLAVEGIQKRKNPDKNYVYILKVVWSDGAINIIYRQCSDFFFLQENLRREFPDAIGKEIPVLKGRKFTENCHFCFKDGTCKRRQFMNQFCHELINAPDSISRGNAVMTFCRPRSSDVLPHGQSDKNDSKKKEAGADDENVQISGPVVFEQYVVIAEYKKKNKNDISLAAGDLVDVIERNDYGWWLVDNEGELGWAPASYLEPTDDGADITTTKSFAPGKEEVYMSIKSYEAQAGDEMSFDAGVIFNVVEKTLDGWWYVSYQNKEGWAPAMFLRKVESGDGLSTSPVSRKMDELDILSFNGENGDKEGLSRTPPTRRSMVKRTVRKKPKRNSSSDAHRGTESVTDESDGSGKSSKSSRSISVPAMVQPANRKPTPRSPRSPRGVSSPRQSPRPLSRPHSREITSDDIDSLLKMKHTSTTSSGYESSPYGSLSSLVSSDVVFTEENSSYSENIRKSATLPSFENVEEDSARRSTPSPVIPRSQSVTSMARYAKSSSVSSLPAKISPVPVPRKNLRKSTAGISPPRSSGSFTPPRYSPRTRNAVTEDLEQSNSEADFDDNQSGSDSPHDSESPESGSEMKTRSLQHPQGRQADKEPADLLDRFGRSRVYRAVYSYASAEDGEVSFNAGDEIEVIQRSDNGWWLVRTVDELGWGPSNFLEVAAF